MMLNKAHIEMVSKWIAYHLPKQVVSYCLIRAWIHATSGRWSGTDASLIEASVVLRRWEEKNG